MSLVPRILVVEARFYDHIADMLFKGAEQVLTAADTAIERVKVPGVLEIPAAVAMGVETGEYDGVVALGCVIRGETTHYDTVSEESARALMDLSVEETLPLGNGILTVENEAQAIVRADPAQKDKGGDAARACLAMIEVKRDFGLLDE